ncbi:hypothetical protein TIFTF001_015975 [Ficus carica]|uniref:Uncharacterized protein n=1 Tax=Ficus carica TaxID=3494 RepID=A0AA88A5G0_FICCA|nr:hypothetical protein TIFTF001_015975 [Ficus carica]
MKGMIRIRHHIEGSPPTKTYGHYEVPEIYGRSSEMHKGTGGFDKGDNNRRSDGVVGAEKGRKKREKKRGKKDEEKERVNLDQFFTLLEKYLFMIKH